MKRKEFSRSVTWKTDNKIIIIPNLKEKAQDLKSLKKAIREDDLKQIHSILELLDQTSLLHFFTDTVQTKHRLLKHAELKVLAISIYRLTKETSLHGTSRYNSETFKLILQKLFTFIDKETLIKDFYERHSFSDQVKEDFNAVMREYDEAITSSEESSLSDINESEEESANHPETRECTQNEEQDTDVEAEQYKDTSANDISKLLEASEFDEHNNQNTESSSLVKENKKETSDNTDNSIESTLIMNDYLSWIYSLPEDIQQYFLNTAHVQELIASVKEVHNIINARNIADKFSQLFEISLEELHKNTWKYNNEISSANELEANNQDDDFSFLPDVSMIFEGDMSNMLMILPIMESGLLGLKPHFNAMELIM